MMSKDRSDQIVRTCGDRLLQGPGHGSFYLRILVIGFNFAIVLAVRSSGQPFLEDPKHFWVHESAYAGSESCKSCHAEIYRLQETSNHALSLRPANEVPELSLQLPVERIDRASDSQLRLAMTADGRIRLTARKDEDQDTLLPAWAFGSGVKGITPVGRNEQGQFVEVRLSWYKSLSAFDFTTGAQKYDPTTAPESLGRRLTDQEISECFGCHTTSYDARRQAPARNEMGVRCERCHGPGLEHVLAVKKGRLGDLSIFHPGRMDAFPQVQMCGACHGTPPEDNHFDALRYVETTPHTVRFPSQRLVLSRCFNESHGDLKCTTCHDAHENAALRTTEFDRACLSCHQAEGGHVSPCPVEVQKCSSCHMPRERVMRNSLFTDHWIRVMR